MCAPPTLLNTLVDFSEPGSLGAFADSKAVAGLARKMERRGYLDGTEIARTFNVLRANDLIWSYVGSNWLMGEQPPAFDILAWNADSTRLPAALHSFYLRSCYVDNEFARGELELDGMRLDPAAITPDLYVLAAKEDHIAPWRSSFEAVRLFSGSDVRFVLTSSGHIAGIVNPPSAKSSHWTDGKPARIRRAGSRARLDIKAHGGKTGPGGPRPVPETGAIRRRWAARRTSYLATRRARTSTRSEVGLR